MCEILNIKETIVEDVENKVGNKESSDEKNALTLPSLTLEKINPVDNFAAQNESIIDGSSKSDNNNSKQNHTVRFSLTGAIHERTHAINTTENVTKLIKFYTVVMLAVIICVLIVICSVPVILYFTNQHNVDLFTINAADFKSCSVSE